MTYFESAEGIMITRDRAFKELIDHGMKDEIDTFIKDAARRYLGRGTATPSRCGSPARCGCCNHPAIHPATDLLVTCPTGQASCVPVQSTNQWRPIMSKIVYAARTVELSQYGQAKPVSLPSLPF